MMSADPAVATGSPAEERVVAELRAGNEHTFRELFERHDATLRRIARAYVDSDAVAEEVVQETWTAVATGIERFQGRSAVTTWIVSVLLNQAKTHSARERRALPFSAVAPSRAGEPTVDPERFQSDDDPWPGHWATPPRPWQRPERRLESLEARAQLRAAFERLPVRQRLVVALRDVEGWSVEEVCASLGISPGNQRVLLHRGRSRLRRVLDELLTDAVV
jgi:RNA polymerase sigma-70 factor (ECF subfamily)